MATKSPKVSSRATGEGQTPTVTGTTVRLSQETATLVNNFAGVGVTFEETVEYLLRHAITAHGSNKLGKSLAVYTPDSEGNP